MNAQALMDGAGTHPLFDAAWYLQQNPDVAAAGVDPLQHYMTHGWREGRDPHPLFDTSFYLEQNKDVAEAGENPLVHYCLFGWREGRDPHPEFDTSWYLEQNPDVAASQTDPLAHYVHFGKQEGRAVKPAPLPFLDLRSLALEYAPLASGSLPTENITDLESIEGMYFQLISEPEISIVIPVYNQLLYTLNCLRSISEQQCTHSFEIVVMDDNSSDRTADVLPRIEGLRYFRNKRNLGFNRNCNRGAELARGKYVLFLNNDTKVLPGWLQALRDTFNEHGNVGIVGSKLIYGDGRLQEAGSIIWEDGSGWNWGRLQDPNHPRYNFVRDVDYLSGSSLMVPRQLFFELGKFSDDLENSYYEDTWLAFAAREAGYRVIYQPKSALIHYEGITSGRDEAGEGTKRYQAVNRRIFFERWKNELRTHLPNGVTPELASDRLPKDHILIIDACTPTPDQDSGSIDMFNLIRILRNAGFRVHFIPKTNFAHFGKYTDQLQSLGIECIYAPYYRSVREFLAERGDAFSHVILARTPVAETVFDDVKEMAPSARIIFYTVDMHGLREVREAELAGDDERMEQARETLRKELALVGRSDVAVVLSEYEAAYLRDRGYRNIAVVPLIRDYTVPADRPSFHQRADVVFIGGFQHMPNVDAVCWLSNEVWPHVRNITRRRDLPPIRLKIVGSKMPDWIKALATDDIEPVGFVEELDDVFSGARLSIAPLRFGAGLKGKVATSLGYGVPTLGTSIAFEGMPSAGLDDIKFCADTAEDLANSVVSLYGDTKRWQAASLAGVQYVERHYSLRALSSKVEFILNSRDCLPVGHASELVC